MDPTIAAAWITGGVGAVGIIGTVATAIVGSRNTMRATEATIAAGTATTTATLAAAREDRLWERRCAVYEETLTGLLYRQAKRREDLRMYRWDEVTEQQVKEFFAGYEPPGFFEARSRLLAYGSNVVIAASTAASKAHGEVRGLCSEIEGLREQIRMAQGSGRLQSAPEGETMINAHRKLDVVLEAAEAVDDALIALIRDELRSKPEAATLPAILPAERRRFRHRR